ncbi:MAG: sulfatase, partial [Pirellulaceae bacterium]|nr:sulfatase [Pirellulaceae bacterium]
MSRISIFATLILVGLGSGLTAQERPNIVWILSEDNSMHYLRLYGPPLGATPQIENLARTGITFDHAFSCSPVCSVARTTLMTGMLGPRIGFHYHRKITSANLPAGAHMFPTYLRRTGYYCTNRAKTDYNVRVQKVWNESSRKASWKNRPTPDTPFFHMQSTAVSHESSLHFNRQTMEQGGLTTKPSDVVPFPYHPDTPTFRYTYARYFDRMHAIDREVGKIIAQLKQQGLYENTIIFYFGDHGGVLPRSKGYLYESGLHVPLVVRVPPKWQHLVTLKPGTRQPGFVSFIDFAPTVLNLAGVACPESMDGKPFLGKTISPSELAARDETLGYADRFDEKYELVRSLRKGKYKYIRNYECYYPDSLQNNYRYRMLAFSEWRDLYRQGKLNDAQSHFFKAKPVELLYDVETDPHEVNNLASDPAFEDILVQLRSRLQQRLLAINDLSFYPENQMIDMALADGAAFGKQQAAEIATLLKTADLALLPFNAARDQLRAALAAKNPRVRFWAVTACSCLGTSAQSLATEVKP